MFLRPCAASQSPNLQARGLQISLMTRHFITKHIILKIQVQDTLHGISQLMQSIFLAVYKYTEINPTICTISNNNVSFTMSLLHVSAFTKPSSGRLCQRNKDTPNYVENVHECDVSVLLCIQPHWWWLFEAGKYSRNIIDVKRYFVQ